MTHFTIELTITDDRFINPSNLGSNTTRRTIYKGKADNDEIALSEAEKICGSLTPGGADVIGRKYRTWVRHHILHKEWKFNSSMVVTFQSELQTKSEIRRYEDYIYNLDGGAPCAHLAAGRQQVEGQGLVAGMVQGMEPVQTSATVLP